MCVVFVMSGDVVKNVCVALTKPYLDAMDGLVREGIYVSRRELVKDALRRLFRHYELEPFGVEDSEEADAK